MIAPQTRAPYRTLDGLRGIAALTVVTRHVGRVFPNDMFPQSFLAVDLFFLISGYVIAHAYGERLRAGDATLGFLKTRLIRLYPLYAAGLAAGAAVRIAASVSGVALDWRWLAEAGVIGMLMLPAVPGLPMGGSALDGPTWTLGPELMVNLVYALVVKRLNRSVLAAIIAVAGVGLVGSEAVYGSLNEGWSAGAWPLLASRIGFSFFMGVLLHDRGPARRVGRAAAWACVAVVGVMLIVRPPAALTHLYELGVVMLAFPLVVAVAVRHEPGALGSRMFALLGAASYAVYVLHQPLGMLVGGAMSRFDLDAPTPVKVVLFVGGVLLAGLIADRLYDAPVRRWLSGFRFRPPRQASGATVATARLAGTSDH